MDPLTLAALIKGGFDVGSGLLSGFGASAKEDEEKNRFNLQSAEDARRFNLQTDMARTQNQQSAGLQGLNFLANQRSEAMKNKRSLSFRNDFLGALGV